MLNPFYWPHWPHFPKYHIVVYWLQSRLPPLDQCWYLKKRRTYRLVTPLAPFCVAGVSPLLSVMREKERDRESALTTAFVEGGWKKKERSLPTRSWKLLKECSLTLISCCFILNAYSAMAVTWRKCTGSDVSAVKPVRRKGQIKANRKITLLLKLTRGCHVSCPGGLDFLNGFELFFLQDLIEISNDLVE